MPPCCAEDEDDDDDIEVDDEDTNDIRPRLVGIGIGGDDIMAFRRPISGGKSDVGLLLPSELRDEWLEPCFGGNGGGGGRKAGKFACGRGGGGGGGGNKTSLTGEGASDPTEDVEDADDPTMDASSRLAVGDVSDRWKNWGGRGGGA